jgi:cell division septation protein DedD
VDNRVTKAINREALTRFPAAPGDWRDILEARPADAEPPPFGPLPDLTARPPEAAPPLTIPPPPPAASAPSFFLMAGAEPERTTSAPAPRSGYTLQVASFHTAKAARRGASRLEKDGLSPFIQPARVKGRTYHRIYHGRYSSRAEAQAAGRKLKKRGRIQDFRVKTLPVDR